VRENKFRISVLCVTCEYICCGILVVTIVVVIVVWLVYGCVGTGIISVRALVGVCVRYYTHL